MQQNGTQRVQDQTRLVGKGDLLGIVQVIKTLAFNHADKWYVHKTESALKNGTHNIHWELKIQSNRAIQRRRPNVVIPRRKELVI